MIDQCAGRVDDVADRADVVGQIPIFIARSADAGEEIVDGFAIDAAGLDVERKKLSGRS